jgi:hypothetical protein
MEVLSMAGTEGGIDAGERCASACTAVKTGLAGYKLLCVAYH